MLQKVIDFYNGVYGEILYLLSNQIEVRLKRSNDRGEFEFDWARSKNNITENLFALASETHSKSLPLHFPNSPFLLRFTLRVLNLTHLRDVHAEIKYAARSGLELGTLFLHLVNALPTELPDCLHIIYTEPVHTHVTPSTDHTPNFDHPIQEFLDILQF